MSLFQPLAGMLPPEILGRLDNVVGGVLGDSYNPPVVSQGVVPSARLVMSAQPANADTIAIGGKTFTFLTTLVAAGATVQVKRGADANASRDNLVKAINGTVDATVWVEATTPFAVAVVADEVGTSVRIRYATARGGLPLAGASGSIVLAESITDAADVWNTLNLNVTGKAVAPKYEVDSSVAITAQMITAGSYVVDLEFTPTVLQVTYTNALGVPLDGVTDGVAISGQTLVITLGGGGAPALVATDKVIFHAST